MEVDKKTGSLDEAKEYALLANLKHGLPLTREEKRHVIAEFLKLHPERSNNWVAEDLGTTTTTVSTIREELESTSKLEVVDYLIAKDGRRFERKSKEPKHEESETTEGGAKEPVGQETPQTIADMPEEEFERCTAH